MPATFQITGRAGANASAHVLFVKGAITHATAPALQEAVRDAPASPVLILELSEVPSVDSMAVGALVRAYVFCSKSGRKLMLAGVNHRVANVLRLTGVDSLFETYATVSEAESAIR
ncbi:MAG TPA: STAS domain-containing protein [Candidatus Acidoferrales bacterium]|nr:STAS domain-containing protein [Candidatus Acidoferrales bacterium]